ncbi:uncharacterized protein LOC126576051 [Anopheles aquasalis]|uniref:uncharacterized protein LOC126576051 n=1 Tax=Anopheles aquasalis TaxID=42839 RepID=UPI00215AFC4A|nr:uncharacterized protein LOC126576051 [Anopheles aquasalis]
MSRFQIHSNNSDDEILREDDGHDELLVDIKPPFVLLDEEDPLLLAVDGHQQDGAPAATTTTRVPHLDETGISRLPFKCPVGGCQERCCLFMLATHVSYDHSALPVESLWPNEPRSVLLDPSVTADEPPRCHMLCLLGGRIRGLGDGKQRDKLPFALISSKYSLHGAERIVLWVTGPDAGGEHRQRYSMEAGRNESSRLLLYAVAFSGQIVPLHANQDAEEIHRRGAGLVIPVQQLERLINSRTKLLEVCVHFH